MVPINLCVFTGKAGKSRSQIGETVKLPVGCEEEVFKIASMHTAEQNSLLYTLSVKRNLSLLQSDIH